MELVRDMKRRTSANATVAMERATSNVSRTINQPQVRHYGMFSAFGYFLGVLSYFGFYKMLCLAIMGMMMGGHLPGKEKVLAEWNKFLQDGVATIKTLPFDVLAFCGVCSGLVLSCTSFSNLIYVLLSFLVYSASGV